MRESGSESETDDDGLTDDEEENIYGTDPKDDYNDGKIIRSIL